MSFRRIFSQSSLAATTVVRTELTVPLCLPITSFSSCFSAISNQGALVNSPASSALASTALVHVSQKRCVALTLKNIEVHGAQASSRLLKDTHPEIAMEIDKTVKNALIPSNSPGTPPTSGEVDLNTLTFDSGRRVPWKCKECAFQWVGSVISRTVLKNGCPSCHRRNNPLLQVVDPKLWQEYNTRKNSIFLDPETLEVTKKDKLWWSCGSCGCEFQARVCDRANGKAPCPECDRGQFADFKVRKVLLEEFHPTKNGDLTLSKLRPTDKVPVWWLCHECGHEFAMPIAIRVANQKRSTRSHQGGCPKCLARKQVDLNAGLEDRRQRRAANRAAKEEAKRNPKRPGRKTKNQVAPDDASVIIA